MSELLKYTIPLTPVTKKNHQQIFRNPKTGKPIVAQSKQYRQYEEAAQWYLKPRPEKPIDEPCNVKMTWYMPTRRRVDRTNLESCTLDVLVKCKILSDDNRDVVASTDGSRVLCDAENPRTEIEIERTDGYEQWAKR